MKVTLISPYPDITSFGIRNISGLLRHHGIRTRLVFLPDPFGDDLIEGAPRYGNDVLDELTTLSHDSDLIGIGLMTNYFDNARQITGHLKKHIGVPILWGGVHPTIRPDECLRFCDLVCIGEGEEAILDVVHRIEHGMTLDDIPNICSNRGGTPVRNPPRPLTQNLNLYPIPDWSCQDHHILENGHIRPLTHNRIAGFLSQGTVSRHLGRSGYQTMTGRGCPHRCTYCINDAVKTLYGNRGYLRWRSPDHVIEELKYAKTHFPFIGFVWISDDAFFSRSLKDIESFCNHYKAEIGLPFSCLASPLTVTEEKMAVLVDANLIYLQMGVQTGSSRIQALFNRTSMNNQTMLNAMRIINRYRNRMYPPSYDFILDVPYETTRDRLDSIRLIADIPKPFRLQPFSLVLYPGTCLHDLAKADGFIRNESREIYTKSYTMRAPTYTNLLILLAKNGRFPSCLLRMLSRDSITMFMESDRMKPIFRILFAIVEWIKKRIKARRVPS